MIKLWNFVILCVVGLTTLNVSAFTIPETTHSYVNDYAHILPSETVSRLNALLHAHEEESTNQIVVVTLPTLENREIADVAIEIEKKWRVGAKGRDNGVVFVVAPHEHKMRIEVGAGLEGALTDLESRIILDEVVRPAFRVNDFNGGISRGTQAIIQAIKGEYRGNGQHHGKVSPLFSLIGILFFVLLFLFFPRAGMLLMLMGGGRGGFGGNGGGFSGGGGSFGGGGASSDW